MLERFRITTFPWLVGVLMVLFTGIVSVNARAYTPDERVDLRRSVMERLSARANVFRETAGKMGWEADSVQEFLVWGWARLLEEPVKVQTSEEAETEYLLAALGTLGSAPEVERAREFVIQDCVWKSANVNFADQFRRAALGAVEQGSEAELDVLARWSEDSAEQFLASVNESRKPAPVPFNHENFPSVALASSTSSTNDFQSFLAWNLLTQNPLDGLCVSQNARLPQITFFALNFTLSAGRKPFLLI